MRSVSKTKNIGQLIPTGQKWLYYWLFLDARYASKALSDSWLHKHLTDFQYVGEMATGSRNNLDDPSAPNT